MPGKRRARYTEEFRSEAVQLARSSPEKSIRQLAHEISVADQTLRNWIEQTEIDRGERVGLTIEEREELKRLRKENRILREVPSSRRLIGTEGRKNSRGLIASAVLTSEAGQVREGVKLS